MKKNMSFPLALAAAGLAASAIMCAAPEPRDYYGRIAQRTVSMLPRSHVLQHPVDDEISRRAWTNIVTFYDFTHSVFLKSDLDALAAHELTIDDELKEGDVSFGFEIYRLYCERLKERIDYATNLLQRAEWDFSVDESFMFERKDSPWPETREEAEEIWRKRMKSEVLGLVLAKELDAERAERKKAASETNTVDSAKAASDTNAVDSAAAPSETNTVDSAAVDDASLPAPAPDAAQMNATASAEADSEQEAKTPQDTPEQSLIKRYRQYALTLMSSDDETVLQIYLSALCRAYDPHSDYFSPASKEDFDMDMNITLCGVGAVLSQEDGALKIAEIIPGGPIDVDGRIKVGDKIVGVKQGGGEMEDIMWQNMRNTIRKIRGKKGTRVTLDILPRNDPTGSTHKYIELVRDEIKLEEQAATGHVERVEHDGVTTKVGYVYLPAFYGTMDAGKRPGDEGFVSCAADVGKWVAEFNAEGVDAMILDLRGNGGGSLTETIALSSLFVADGPVVLTRSPFAVVALPIPRGDPVAFRKPLVVMTDRSSASASEIIAAHLKDIGRAVVVGDSRTHGKGTVQSVLGLGPKKYGSLKVTTQRFYRINGMSTQVAGVEPDIVLPSLADYTDMGEAKLQNALPFSRIRAADYRPCWNMAKHVPELARLSSERTAKDKEFQEHLRHAGMAKAVYDRKEVPLERAKRKAMMASDREVREYAEDDEEDEETAASRRAKARRARLEDPVLREAFNVAADLVRLNGGDELPATPTEWYNALLGF